jgi:hypothetical protein
VVKIEGREHGEEKKLIAKGSSDNQADALLLYAW